MFMRGPKAGACQRAVDMPARTKRTLYEGGRDGLQDWLSDICRALSIALKSSFRKAFMKHLLHTRHSDVQMNKRESLSPGNIKLRVRQGSSGFWGHGEKHTQSNHFFLEKQIKVGRNGRDKEQDLKTTKNFKNLLKILEVSRSLLTDESRN